MDKCRFGGWLFDERSSAEAILERFGSPLL